MRVAGALLRIGERVNARSVVLATGARYRRLDVENLGAFEASSVHYWASPIEAKLCANREVALVGAGNSAGQAVVYLASQGVKVSMLVRRSDLAATMSRYLVDRIRGLANVEIVAGAAISGLEGRDASPHPFERDSCREDERPSRADPDRRPACGRRPLDVADGSDDECGTHG